MSSGWPLSSYIVNTDRWKHLTTRSCSTSF